MRYVEAQGGSVVNTNRRTRHRVRADADFDHDWKIMLRLNGVWQWNVNNGDDTDPYGFKYAGRIYTWGGQNAGVIEPGWSNISASNTVYFVHTYNTAGSSTISFTLGAGLGLVPSGVSPSPLTIPAVFVWRLGSIVFNDDGIPYVVQNMREPIDYSSKLTPQFYASYSETTAQILTHNKSGSDPVWSPTAADTKERLFKLTSGNTMGTLAAETTSGTKNVVTDNNVFRNA